MQQFIRERAGVSDISRIYRSEILQYSDVSEYTDYDEKDNIGQDISCNLGSLNIVNVMKQKDIEQTVRYSIKALTKVADKTDIKNAPAVRKANNEMHSVGLKVA